MKCMVRVSVRADHLHDGRIVPRMFRMSEDVPPVPIDRLLAVDQTGAFKAGWDGWRYTCRVEEKMVYLYHSHGLWFVEV